MRPDLLLWLTESHRNFHVSGPGLSGSLARELQTHEPWTQGIAYEDFPLRYEPRSLARSPNGKKIVVGTKAGFLQLASWDGNRWLCESEWQLSRESEEQGEAISRSIRAVRFLDDFTVVAGWGEGVFGVFDAHSLTRRHLVRSEPASQAEGRHRREYEWLDRFARFIALVPPSASESCSAVMLGVTLGSQVHVLYRDGDVYKARIHLPEEIFPQWAEGARVVDGVWSHNFLWVLDSSGHIYRYAPDDPKGSTLQIPLSLLQVHGVVGKREGETQMAKGIFHLEHPREIGEFRAIASCVMGLAVLTSDDVTFLRFKMPQDGSDSPSLEPSIARWVAVPSAIDCSVCLPFSNYYSEEPLASQAITRENPVWTVVGSSHFGLRWISWHDPRSDSTGRLPAISHAHRAGSGDSSVLQVRFGFHDRGGPTYIVCATRDHRLRIATLLDRIKTEKLLAREIPRALAEDPLLAQESGIAWWLTLQRIRDDFDPSAASNAAVKDEPRKLLRFTEREDLNRLIRWVLTRWSESPLDAYAKRKLVQDWTYHILARAYQIEQSLAQELARLAHDRIAQMRGRRGEEGRQVEADLGMFAAFLRKWVVFGHTYGEKTRGLLQLYDWNRSGHVLDALAYLTKLLRRRVDPLWEVRPTGGAPGLAVWDLVAPASGAFSIHSSTDGRITALARDGEMLAWEPADPVARVLETHCLEICQGQLRHRLAEEFLRKYRHGPYARTLLLSQTSEDDLGTYLLVFCLRGWRREDLKLQDEHKPRLYALLLQPSPSGIRILAIDSQPLPDEVYGLCELEGLTQRGKRHVLVAGTKGAWRSGERWMPRPFIELLVVIDGADQTHLELDQKIEVPLERRGERSVFKSRLDYLSEEEILPETAHNPCWSLCSFTSPAGEIWIWAGFLDGHIRCFLRTGEPSHWSEGGGGGVTPLGDDAPSTHQESGLTTSAPVWRLHVLKEQKLLAYGSADGIIGVVSLSEKRSSAVSRSHLVHHRESSPICGLSSYVDPEGGTRLLAVTQDGVAILFDLEVLNRPQAEGRRIRFPGLSIDRFTLAQGARAVAIVAYDDQPHRELLGGPLQALLVGSNEGSILKHALALPRGTRRRQTAFHEWCSRLLEHRNVQSVDGTRQPPPLSQFVGDNVYGWLRVLDVRGVHLLRYSISSELRMQWPHEEIPALAKPERLQRFLARLNELADDIYGRRPLTPEPAKVIWEEAARVANRLAEVALEKEGEEQNALLAACLELNRTIDDLCNRWIGSEQAVESRVLMHTFNCLFDWVGIVLIGLAHPSSMVLSVRRFLLHNLIQRRLSFNDRLVYLEALSTLNVAMMRSVSNADTTAGDQRWKLSLRPEGAGRTGLYDLLTMVGDLGEQHAGSLTPADPLWTELSRFFAASLLLLPRGSFVISQVVAESRLTEKDTRFALAVLAQAEVIFSQLAMVRTPQLQLALDQFRDSFDDDIDATICRPPGVEKRDMLVVSKAWQQLLKEAAEAEERVPKGGYGPFSNEAFLLDHAAAIRTTAYLIWLSNEESLPQLEQYWLGRRSRYFEHSRRYLRHLLDTWKEVRRQVHPTGRYDGTNRLGHSSISRALQLCEDEETYLESTADLFEPQRTQYTKVIAQWREQIWNRAEDAVELLDVLDKFNRHAYRASSDRLMSSITELAFQTAPLWLDMPDRRPLRAEIERRLVAHPLVRTIFDSGNRLVASTHLAGTLFAVARDYYRTSSSAPTPRQTTLKDIEAELATFCSFEDLELSRIGILTEEISAPGTLAVWDTILQEVVTNTKKYCSSADRKLIFACELRQEKVWLSFAGRRPFIECLHPYHLEQLDETLPLAQRLDNLQKLVNLAKKPGWRLAPPGTVEEGSSGMGLPLILRICHYLGMQADIILLDPATRYKGRKVSDEERLRWPLCLEIGWEDLP